MKKMKEKYGGWADVFRGLLVVTCSPLILGYFVLSFVNQTIRKCPCIPITKVVDLMPSNEKKRKEKKSSID
jgi:hypothetical protein